MELFCSVKWIVSLTIIANILVLSVVEAQKKPREKKCTKSILLNKDGQKDAKFNWDPSGTEGSCLWSVIGTKKCSVRIKCSIELPAAEDCRDAAAFMKISDGGGGEKYFCGKSEFTVKPSEDVLRDLYLSLDFEKTYKDKGVKCEAGCSWAGEPLPKQAKKKYDMRCVCGLQNKDDRIVGGEDAMLNEFPWQAAVVYAKTRSPNCGGSIINDRFAFTAAHCFWFDKKKPEQIDVLVHAHTLDMTKKKSAKDVELGKDGSIRSSGWDAAKKTDEDENTQRFKVVEIINHPLFNEYYDFDVALLRLDKKIDLSAADAPTPMCLPQPNVFDSMQPSWVGKNMTVVGWGLAAENAGGTTRVLQKLDIPYIEDGPCKESNPELITPRMMCAGYTDGTQKDACTGDSGGPLIFKRDNKQFIQAGVVSWGEGCARKGKPGVYSKVTEMMQWVLYHTMEDDAKWCKDDK